MLWRSISPARRPPGFVQPCLPTLADSAPSGLQWAFEIKHDGFRFTCRRDRDSLRVFSRRGHDWTERVPAIAALALLPVASVTIDGEGVACGSDGVSDFERMRAAVGETPYLVTGETAMRTARFGMIPRAVRAQLSRPRNAF